MARKTKTVGISLTEAEYDRLTKVAITKGVSPTTVAGDYVRSALPVFDTLSDFERYLVNEEMVDTPEDARAVTELGAGAPNIKEHTNACIRTSPQGTPNRSHHIGQPLGGQPRRTAPLGQWRR